MVQQYSRHVVPHGSVLLPGLMVDEATGFKTQRETESKKTIAREVERGTLPKKPP